MPAKNPWQHDVVQLNNKGLDLIHPIEQVDAEHYSRMEDVKSLQEGTLTPRPGTSLINSVQFQTGAAATARATGIDQIPRGHGESANASGYVTNTPQIQWVPNILYIVTVAAESLAGGTTDVTCNAMSGGGMTFTEIDDAHFNTIANPNAVISVWRGMKTTSSNVDNLTIGFDVTVDTGLIKIQAFQGINITGGEGASAISDVTTFTSDGTDAPSITLSSAAGQDSTFAAFTAREVGTITKGSAFEYALPGGAGHYITEWVETMLTTADATVDTSRAIAGIGFHIVGA